MKIATQSDLDQFTSKVVDNDGVFPYLNVTNYFAPMKVEDSLWNYVYFVNNTNTCLLKINFDRPRNEINVSLYSLSALSAGRALKFLFKYIKRLGVRAVNSAVHESNLKSMLLHEKIYGAAWGCEKQAAWNCLSGKYEDLYYYRKLL